MVDMRRAFAVATLVVGWVWPTAAAVDVCLHLAAEHALDARVENAAMLVLHGHTHVHGVAPHEHDLAVGAAAPVVRPHAAPLGLPPGNLSGDQRRPTHASWWSLSASSRGSPEPLHVLHCSFLI